MELVYGNEVDMGYGLYMSWEVHHIQAVGAFYACRYLAMARVSRVLLTRLGLLRWKVVVACP